MSIEAQRLVRAVDELSGPQKAVLGAYANYAAADGRCWAGTARIAFDTGYSVSTVVRARRALVRRGWLKSTRRMGTSSVTRLDLARITEAGIRPEPRGRRLPQIEFDTDDPVTASDTAGGAGDTGVRGAPAQQPERTRTQRSREARQARQVETPVEALVEAPLDRVCAGHSQSGHSDLYGESAVTSPRERSALESFREPSGDLSLDTRAHASTTEDPVPDRSERKSETAPPNPDPAPVGGPGPAAEQALATAPAQSPPPAPETAGTEPEAWALELIAGLDYGPHRRPTQARARTLAVKLVAAHTGGLSQRDLRRHCRAALNQARRNGVAYLDGALHPDHLPIPAPDTGPITAPAPAAAPVAGAADDRPTSPAGAAGPADPAPMDRAHAQAEIRRILTRRRPDVGPETPTDARTTATPTDHPSTAPEHLNGGHSGRHNGGQGHTPTTGRYRRRLYRRR